MSRFIKLLLTNPLALFKLIYYIGVIFVYKIKGFKTIVYNLHHDYFYDIFYTIYKNLKTQKKIVVFFAYKIKNDSLIDYLNSKIDKKFLIPNTISPFIPFDLFICSEITGPDFPFKFLHTKSIETYHGNGVSALYKKIDVLNRFDIHFVIGPKFNEFLEQAYKDKKKKPKIYNVGYSKLDLLIQHDPLTDKLRNEFKLGNKFTILYAPHWNPFGSIHKFKEAIIRLLASYDVNLLIKPHHYLFTKYKDMNWRAIFSKLEEEFDNVTIAKRPNTQELYPLADVMISDVGTSSPIEFCLLKKPLLIFDNQRWFEEEEYDYEERKVLEAAIRFKTIPELRKYLDELINKSDNFLDLVKKQKIKQEELINDLLYNPGKATEKAVEAILTELNN